MYMKCSLYLVYFSRASLVVVCVRSLIFLLQLELSLLISLEQSANNKQMDGMTHMQIVFLRHK